MDKRSDNRKESTNGGEKRNTNDDLRRSTQENTYEFLPVPENQIGLIIGRKGRTIIQIQETSGAKLSDQSQRGRSGFAIRGNERQRARARELIHEKLETRFRIIEIPKKFEYLVKGTDGDELRRVSIMTGAVEKSKGHDSRVYVSGPERNAKHAEYVIKSRMAAARVGVNSVCVCIDDKYLPEDCELQLVEEMEHSILLGSSSQYRLKPCEEYDMDAKGADALDQAVAKCDDCIEKRVLTSLRSLKMEIGSGNYQKANLWCHFGKIVIKEPDEADLEETWSIDNSIKKFQRTEENKNAWRATFKEGVNLADKVVSDTFGDQIGEDFMARYDLTFLSPKSQTMRFKVWVANKDVGKKLEEIPIPFDDLKNVVEELRFEDESTKARCRGWLVLHSKKFLDVNIIFPGSDVDCRISLRAVMDDLVANNSLVREEEETHLISNYLSKVTFSDADGLRLPEDEKLPRGFNFVHQRCSRRTLFTPRPGFTMIVSNERSWYSNLRDEENKVTTDIHLHCEKWDQLLNEEDWEPETICAELSEFLYFVRQVQDFICCKSNKTADQE